MTCIFLFWKSCFTTYCWLLHHWDPLSRRCKTTINIKNRALAYLSWFLNQKILFLWLMSTSRIVFSIEFGTQKMEKNWKKSKSDWKNRKKQVGLKMILWVSLAQSYNRWLDLRSIERVKQTFAEWYGFETLWKWTELERYSVNNDRYLFISKIRFLIILSTHTSVWHPFQTILKPQSTIRIMDWVIWYNSWTEK